MTLALSSRGGLVGGGGGGSNPAWVDFTRYEHVLCLYAPQTNLDSQPKSEPALE